MTTEKEQLEAEIAKRDARLAGAERCAECGTITARLDGDGCAKWCCHCGARLNGDYVNVAALKAQPSAGAADLRQVATDALMGMIAAITGTTPPADQPPPPFIQSAIDRAVDRIARLNPCRAQAVPEGCNGSGCGSCWYECHETDHIAGGRNMVTGPVGQIERWFCEGRDSIDGAACRYGAHTLARHWWSRGYSYTQRQARAIIAEAQLNCDPEDIAQPAAAPSTQQKGSGQ